MVGSAAVRRLSDRWLDPWFLGPLAVAAIAIFAGLGSVELHEVDEGWYAPVVRELADGGSFWHPTEHGRPFWIKPMPLLGLAALSCRLFGFGPFGLRLLPALFALLAVAMTMAIGRRVSDRKVAALAALILVANPLFLFRHAARSLSFDTLLLATCLLASLLVLRASETGRGWIVAGAAAGAASLAKNFAGVLPLGVAVLFLVLGWPRHRPSTREAFLALGAWAAVPLAWILPMAAIHGRTFLEVFVVRELLDRPTLHGAYPPLWASREYALTLAAGFFPWIFPAVLGLPREVRRAIEGDRGARWTLLWLLATGLVLVLGLRRALQWYLLPLLPFLALVAARWLLSGDSRSRALRCTALAVATGGSALLRPPPEIQPFKIWSLVELRLAPAPVAWSLLVASGAVVGFFLAFRRRPHRRALSAAIGALSVAALGNLAPIYSELGYRNVHARASDAIADELSRVDAERPGIAPSRSGTRGTLALGSPRPDDRLGTFYFGSFEGYDLRVVQHSAAEALRIARRSRGTSFAVLVRRSARPLAPPPRGRTIFHECEAGGPTLDDLWVTVVRF